MAEQEPKKPPTSVTEEYKMLQELKAIHELLKEVVSKMNELHNVVERL